MQISPYTRYILYYSELLYVTKTASIGYTMIATVLGPGLTFLKTMLLVSCYMLANTQAILPDG